MTDNGNVTQEQGGRLKTVTQEPQEQEPEGFRRVCSWCGKKFIARHPGARYCSAACKQAAYRERKARRNRK